jgi:hypothetical protein
LKELEADQAAADGEERFVDVVASFVADAEAAVLVQPGDRALDDPALGAKPGAVRCLRRRDPRLDAAAAKLAAAFARVVGTVAVQPSRSAARPAAASAHRWDRVDQRDHLGDVVAIAAGQPDRQRTAAAADDQVVLGAASGAVDRARAGLGAPPNALTWELSIAARDQSISSASFSLASSSS